MKHQWLWAGVVATGLIGLAAPSSWARGERAAAAAEGHVGRQADGEQEVKFDDLPLPAKQSLEKERAGHRVSKVTFVRRNGQEFYRALIEDKDRRGNDRERAVRVTADGKLLTELDVVAKPATPAAPAAVPDEGAVVNYEDAPGAVRTTVGREALNDKVVSLRRFNRPNQVIYEALVSNAAGDRQRVIRVLLDGTLLVDENATPAGAKDVPFDQLPGGPKGTIGRLAEQNKVVRVIQTSRGERGLTFTALIDLGSSARWITVDETGKVLSDVQQEKRPGRPGHGGH